MRSRGTGLANEQNKDKQDRETKLADMEIVTHVWDNRQIVRQTNV